MVRSDPRVCCVKNLVSQEEAEDLIAAASDVGLKQSLVASMREKMGKGSVDAAGLKEQGISEGRTSTSCRVPRSHPVAAAAVMRAAFLCGLSPHCSEAVQVVHYERGQRYDVHNDWFQPGTPYYHDRVCLSCCCLLL